MYPPLIPPALWDNKLAMKEKESLAKSLLSLSSPSDNQQLLKRFGTGFGKPVLPITGQGTMSNFINDDCMQMFYIMLKISNSFLDKSIEEWEQDDAYLKGEEIVNALRVCNDSAERGVKLVAEFLHLAQKEDNLQKFVQVAVQDRKKLPNQRKRRLSNA